MTGDEDLAAGVAHALSAQAHGLRNELNVLSMASGMVDDEQLAAELRATAGSLTRAIERLVVAARVELGRQPALAQLTAGELVRLAERRARREGRARLRVADVSGEAVEMQLALPGSWAERLVADLLHLTDASADAVQVSVTQAAGEQGAAGVALTVHGATQQPDALLQQLAAALDVELARDADRVIARIEPLPKRSGVVSRGFG